MDLIERINSILKIANGIENHAIYDQLGDLRLEAYKLASFERQVKLPEPACASGVIAETAMKLFEQNVKMPFAIRSIGVRACDLLTNDIRQLSIFPDSARIQKQEELEKAVDSIRSRFGHFVIQRGVMMTDKQLSSENPKDDHTIHPIAFSK